MSRSGGEKGLRLSGAGKLDVPLERDWYVEELFELHQGCQVPFRISKGNVGFPLTRSSGKGPHLAITGETSWFFSSCDRILELQWGTQGASRAAPGKCSLHSSCEEELGIALE